jgi:alpha-beta hydrolase superfamily lysophospholipase
LFWLGVLGVILLSLAVLVAGFFLTIHILIIRHYLQFVLRIFQEKPLFIIPFGKPDPEAEDIELPGPEGLVLRACYWKAKTPRKGVLWFGLEFGSSRWSAGPYCDFLREAGYDVFACESRGQGQTPTVNGYEPLQWVTRFDVEDYRIAFEHLKNRPDADPRGIGLFGLSKGAAAGVLAAADDAVLRCAVTDGMFGTRTTMIPYMAQWVMIYTPRKKLAKHLPKWYLSHVAGLALGRIEDERKVKYPSLVTALRKLGDRPILMIHGGADNYIKPDMARSLFRDARDPKELWIVDGAKHNQAAHVAGDEYRRRIREFFDKNLAEAAPLVRERVPA